MTRKHLRDTPAVDRSGFTGMHDHHWMPWVADLFSGRGGVGRVLDTMYHRNNYFGVDVEDYGDEYPGQFIQADLINNDPPLSFPTAHLVWVSFPCTAYSTLSAIEYGSKEAALEQNPRIPESGIREWAQDNGVHYVIENVPGATRVGDLKANVRLNGLAFGHSFSMERHFETSFPVPDAYVDGKPDTPISTDGDQSVKALAEEKGVPASWGKQGVRSAMPQSYVEWILHYAPSVPSPAPDRPQTVFSDAPDPYEIAPMGNP